MELTLRVDIICYVCESLPFNLHYICIFFNIRYYIDRRRVLILKRFRKQIQRFVDFVLYFPSAVKTVQTKRYNGLYTFQSSGIKINKWLLKWCVCIYTYAVR